MKPIQKKRMILAFVLVVILGVGIEYSFYLYNKPRITALVSSTELRIDAAVLFRDYKQDELLANHKYLNKIIEVKGIVQEIDSSSGNMSVLLLTGSEGAINCSMAVMPKADIHKKEILVKGKCAGFMMDVMMVDCVIP
ncbi:OB-fold putative lipoprotein [Flavihumibacter profundi]|jgi:hypothetical protein|uniref:OB-fold putative lipoprotein n=1 Tax=Flavihumibacter profundi TaxID=2716883 RepID=UPI001CC3E3C2|nr:OB-fold putative lipoprotein [Flavihumibacter profundi]MBZ5856774.1 OB-fold putative lipoprotein [Flavihumibacter profundi]